MHSHDAYGRNRGYSGNGDIKKSDESPPLGDYDVEKVDTRRQGEVLPPAMAHGSNYKVLNRWQASLIYITNQVGIGILSLPTAMQTLGLIPGIICIIGMGMWTILYEPSTCTDFKRPFQASSSRTPHTFYCNSFVDTLLC